MRGAVRRSGRARSVELGMSADWDCHLPAVLRVGEGVRTARPLPSARKPPSGTARPASSHASPWGAVGGLCVESPKRALVGLTAPSPAVPVCGLNDNPIPCLLRRVEAQRLSL